MGKKCVFACILFAILFLPMQSIMAEQGTLSVSAVNHVVRPNVCDLQVFLNNSHTYKFTASGSAFLGGGSTISKLYYFTDITGGNANNYQGELEAGSPKTLSGIGEIDFFFLDWANCGSNDNSGEMEVLIEDLTAGTSQTVLVSAKDHVINPNNACYLSFSLDSSRTYNFTASGSASLGGHGISISKIYYFTDFVGGNANDYQGELASGSTLSISGVNTIQFFFLDWALCSSNDNSGSIQVAYDDGVPPPTVCEGTPKVVLYEDFEDQDFTDNFIEYSQDSGYPMIRNIPFPDPNTYSLSYISSGVNGGTALKMESLVTPAWGHFGIFTYFPKKIKHGKITAYRMRGNTTHSLNRIYFQMNLIENDLLMAGTQFYHNSIFAEGGPSLHIEIVPNLTKYQWYKDEIEWYADGTYDVRIDDVQYITKRQAGQYYHMTGQFIPFDEGIDTLTIFDAQQYVNDVGVDDITVISYDSEPVLSPITAPVTPVPVETEISASAELSDTCPTDSLTAIWNWGDNTTSNGVVTETEPSAWSITGSHTYSAPGVYILELTVLDGEEVVESGVYEYVVVFTPREGNEQGSDVRGQGIIYSPEGAYTPDPTLSGEAKFGFQSKYEPGAHIPTGNTQFKFKAGHLHFKSDTFDWLVVAGARAQFKGSGTINDEGDYGFMVTAIDGEINGGGDTDKFRIKIWDKSTDEIIYDNMSYLPDIGDPDIAILEGDIAINKFIKNN